MGILSECPGSAIRRSVQSMDSGFIGVDGCDLYTQATGRGRNVLLLHAGVADSRMWNDQMANLAGFRLIRHDMRGYGRSELGSEPFTNHRDALTVLDHFDAERAVIVGCSAGANAALQLAKASPERVEGLVLVGGDAPGFDPGIQYQSPQWPDAVEAFEAGDLQRVAQLEAEIWLAGVGRSCTEMDPRLVELFIEMDLIALRNETTREELEASEPLVGLPTVDLPVLVVVGDRDLPQLVAAAEHLADKLSNRPAAIVADSAHLPPMDRPEAFNRLLSEFLAAI